MKKKISGGGTRSEEAPAYHLVPGFGHRRTALRFGLGAQIHGPENWKKSCLVEEDAYEWCSEAYNHMQEHMLKMGRRTDIDDDHLGAIGFGVEVLAYCEHVHGKLWTSLRRRDAPHVIPDRRSGSKRASTTVRKG